MKITVLNENCAGSCFSAEHGLSYLIESEITFLFDTGPSDIILKNARKAGIDINLIDTIVLSHRHYDHSNGLKYLNGQRLICHPAVFNKNFRKRDNSYIGMPISKKEAEGKFDLTESASPLQLSENTFFLGEIPKVNNFEAQSTVFIDENGNDDFIPDDSGVVIKTSKGLVVISGCAHSGICNMVEHSINIAGDENVHAVIGGFHLKDNGEQTLKTVEFLRSKNVDKVIPSHCTELPAQAEFYKVWPFRQIKTGQVINF